ncbi:MAG TPA: isoaspartyl peptidase/L-asparaginase [Pirellulales bacterium]|nr:isoaspartyl peptidase/L-asparaginase [Pirellulales bacterium]
MTSPSALHALAAEKKPAATDVVLAIHGGMADDEEDVSEEEAKALREVLAESLRSGHQRLMDDDASIDAVETAIKVLEDSPLFNAGKGAVFTFEGRNELDASIMEGKEKRAGAVAGVTIVKNPISAARAVMEKSPHVLLTGRGAEVFATKAGLEIVDPGYFWTLPRWKDIEDRWRKARSRAGKQSAVERKSDREATGDVHWGTVGAVAVDGQGNLAAGTSTGGMTGKMYGRVGDSPIIGAGTYADNEGCAVSCTGHGEFFIRFAVSHEINALVKYKGLSVAEAVERVIGKELEDAGGNGGAIVLDAQGRFSAAQNGDGMYHGWITRDGRVETRLWEK